MIRLEKVEVPKVEYSDNEKCLHMLESAPTGTGEIQGRYRVRGDTGEI